MVWRLGWFIVVVASVTVSLWRLTPPNQDVGGFSTDTALGHLRFLSTEIHPVGSPFHQQVRDYLVDQFKRLGYEVQTQDAAVPLRYDQREGPRVPVSNVLARKAGTDSSHPAVMLAAHYDSARVSPGAGD